MTARTAWAAAMKYENRANPYPFFDELRKTPVVQVADNLYVVTGYRELLALAHDPRISSDVQANSASAPGRIPRSRNSSSMAISRASSSPIRPITIAPAGR